MTTIVVTPPAAEVVSLEEITSHLRLIETDETGSGEDELLSTLRSAAVTKIEDMTGLAFINRTLQTTFNSFGRRLVLPISPVVSVASITYLDTAGEEQTLEASDYALHDRIDNPGVIPAHGRSWPATWDFPGSVSVEYVAGFGAGAANVPDTLRLAVLRTIGGMYDFREDIGAVSLTAIPEGVTSLIAGHRRWDMR